MGVSIIGRREGAVRTAGEVQLALAVASWVIWIWVDRVRVPWYENHLVHWCGRGYRSCSDINVIAVKDIGDEFQHR